MYNLDLLSKDVKDDFGRILTLTLIGSFFGLFYAVPLRKFFIVNVARELRLIFPTGKGPPSRSCPRPNQRKLTSARRSQLV